MKYFVFDICKIIFDMIDDYLISCKLLKPWKILEKINSKSKIIGKKRKREKEEDITVFPPSKKIRL